MRPYSFAAAAALEAAGNPLTELPITPADVICYLQITSAKDPLSVRIKASWLDKLRAIRLLNPKHMLRVMRQIREYEEDYGSMPTLAREVETESADGIPSFKKSITAPWIASRVASLHQNTNLTDREIWSLPIGYTMWLDAAGAEIRGGKLTFIDPENPELTEADIAELRELAKEPVRSGEKSTDGWVSPEEVWGKKKEKVITPEKKRKRSGRKTRRVDKTR